jgi:hypothetical protein
MDDAYAQMQRNAQAIYEGPPGSVFTQTNEVDEVARALEEGRLAGIRAQELAMELSRVRISLEGCRVLLRQAERELRLERERRHHWQRRALTAGESVVSTPVFFGGVPVQRTVRAGQPTRLEPRRLP